MEIWEDRRIAVIEKKSEAFPYARLGSSDEVALLPPHPEFGSLRAFVQCETITQDHPYVALRLECGHGKAIPATTHFMENGWTRTTVQVTLVAP